MTAPLRMPLTGAVAVVRQRRGPEDIVVSSMGNARAWMALGPLHELDLVLVPSAMGHATSMGLGLALAQPARRVIVLSGDGSLLMNLGSLVTIAAEAPANLVVVVFVNGVYEVTGAQNFS
jgi:phosphonopyruvate decarboxylase